VALVDIHVELDELIVPSQSFLSSQVHPLVRSEGLELYHVLYHSTYTSLKRETTWSMYSRPEFIIVKCLL
jgi:hypothetical protein